MGHRENSEFLQQKVQMAVWCLDESDRHELFRRGFVTDGEKIFPNPEALPGIDKQPFLELTSRGVFPLKVIRIFREIARVHGWDLDIQRRSDLHPPLTRS